jgi:hypothetical protein
MHFFKSIIKLKLNFHYSIFARLCLKIKELSTSKLALNTFIHTYAIMSLCNTNLRLLKDKFSAAFRYHIAGINYYDTIDIYYNIVNNQQLRMVYFN